MEWAQVIDGYCERTDPSYWSEPLNALTNLAFVIAAALMWRRLRGEALPRAHVLCAVLAVIGVGSYLFHTQATVWASVADVVPILGFILLYLYAANRDFIGLGRWASAFGTVLFIPYALLLTPAFGALPFFRISAFYWPVPFLIAAYALALRRHPATARGLLIGAAILTLSIVFRSLDLPLCARVPVGTHFLWHILNALMLGWMIEIYRRHMLATGRSER